MDLQSEEKIATFFLKLFKRLKVVSWSMWQCQGYDGINIAKYKQIMEYYKGIHTDWCTNKERWFSTQEISGSLQFSEWVIVV